LLHRINQNTSEICFYVEIIFLTVFDDRPNSADFFSFFYNAKKFEILF
jgi:hypothetical protein